MKFCLKNTDIFDETLAQKALETVLKNKEKFAENITYSLKVSFAEKLLEDDRFNTTRLAGCDNESDKKERIYMLLNWQLEQILEALKLHGINLCTGWIQGEYLKHSNTISIVLKKRSSKSGNRGMVTVVSPSFTRGQSIANKAVNEFMRSQFYELVEVLGDDRLLMCQLFGIEPTNDIAKLYVAFFKQYKWRDFLKKAGRMLKIRYAKN